MRKDEDHQRKDESDRKADRVRSELVKSQGRVGALLKKTNKQVCDRNKTLKKDQKVTWLLKKKLIYALAKRN